MIDISGENVVLVGALLLFVAVMAGKVAYRFGAPALLLFLGVGMLFGLDFISYRSVDMTQFVGMIALCIILFTGGMDTSFQEIKPIIGPGVVLATVGVVMTAVVLAGFVWLIAPWIGLQISFPLALLLASTMSSTDSASVFSILRSKKQGLKQHLRPLLELESGSNDPMAYMMTILLISIVTNTSGGVGMGMSIVYFVIQMIVGALSGYLIGRLAVWTINKINLANHSLYSVLLLAFIFFAFAFTDLVRGNGYLAVYLAGLVVGNHKLTQKRSLTVFFDGFTWLMQIVMFLTLGLFVNSDELFSNNKVTVMNFWFTTCKPCVGELGDLENLNKELAEKGGQVVGVNSFTLDGNKDEIADAKDVLSKKGVTYKNIWFKSDSEAGKFTSNLFSFPTTYVIDQNGNIVGEPIMGAISSAEQRAALDKLIDQAIAKSEQ